MPYVWEQRKLGEIVTRITAGQNKSDFPQVEYENVIPEYGQLKGICNATTKKGVAFTAGDIVYGKLRPYLKKWFLAKFSGTAVGDFWVLRPREKISTSFVYALIQSKEFQLVANITSGTKMPRADWTNVSEHKYIVPVHIEEQKSIGSLCSIVDNLIVANERNRFGWT
ncbi:restriction endonuclease subunit S [Levilactobacillus lanxiensis]|uniref:Restriction endonuclease subunit S n=1 Tax=Levilactobacillus lanxiensis TaxID=2799568 RepID=A0ABW4D4K4_9LACO|nr:restriction endonuclease subunit S [Levilactobacillus lanxiensis]